MGPVGALMTELQMTLTTLAMPVAVSSLLFVLVEHLIAVRLANRRDSE